MFVRVTLTKSDPASAEAARALYNSDEVSGVLDRQKGPRFHYSSNPLMSPARASL